MRASDNDRAGVAALLQDAVARGLLAHDEGSERLGVAFGARFIDELTPLTADLPPVPEAVPSPIGWRRLAATLVTQVGYEIRGGVTSGVRSRRFLVLVLTAVLLIGLLVTLGGLTVHGLFDGGYEPRMEFDGR